MRHPRFRPEHLEGIAKTFQHLFPARTELTVRPAPEFLCLRAQARLELTHAGGRVIVNHAETLDAEEGESLVPHFERLASRVIESLNKQVAAIDRRDRSLAARLHRAAKSIRALTRRVRTWL